MPIYEYRRPDGTTFEVMQKMSDPPLTQDPETGVPVQRVFAPVAIHFKGSGFHNTDYGTRKRNRETQAAAEGGSSDSGGGEKGGEKKESSSSSSSSSSKESKGSEAAA